MRQYRYLYLAEEEQKNFVQDAPQNEYKHYHNCFGIYFEFRDRRNSLEPRFGIMYD